MDYYTTDIKLSYDKNNKEHIIKLWDEAFSDPEDFTNYYFSNVYSKNKVLSAYYKDELVGMIHLNPYRIFYMGDEYNSCYIVGVAVRQDMRGKGIMKLMMKKVLEDIKSECPFAFLMPANKLYYTGLGFEQIYNTTVLDFSITDEEDFARDVMDNYSPLMLDMISMKEAKKESYEDTAKQLNRIMKKRYNGFALRDSAYIEDMIMEHTCQNGDVTVVIETETGDDGEEIYYNLVGLYCYDIYDEVMYVERFQPTEGNMVALLTCVMKQAVDVTCDRIIVTVADEDMDDVSHLVTGVNLDITKGKGMMAVGLGKKNQEIVAKLSSRCYFDEIV